MPSIDEPVKELFNDCPILLDKKFQEEHPGIINTAVFLNELAKKHYKALGSYKAFDKLGVNNIKDYISLIQKGNPKAIQLYQKTRDICGFE